MENTNGITGIEKFQPKGVMAPTPVQADIKEKLTLAMPQARKVLADVRAFIPLRDQVMVRRLEPDEMTQLDTLYVPEQAREKPIAGIVLAVGRGKLDAAGIWHECECSVSDVVLFATRYSGTEHKINGETVLVMNESQIVGILR